MASLQADEVYDLPGSIIPLASAFSSIKVGKQVSHNILFLFDPIDSASRILWANAQQVYLRARFWWAPIPDIKDNQSVLLAARLLLSSSERRLEECMLGFLEAEGEAEFSKQAAKNQLAILAQLQSIASQNGVQLSLPVSIWRTRNGTSAIPGVPSAATLKKIAVEALRFKDLP